MIPRNIQEINIIEAIAEVDRNGVPPGRTSRKYYLEYRGKAYPPKYLISLANKFVNGEELDPSEFGGGEEANSFLKGMGFRIVTAVPTQEIHPVKIRRETRTIARDFGHSERCPACKETIEELLRKAYGEVKPNHRFEVGTHPDDFRDKPYYEDLRRIFVALQDHRGFKEFVRTMNLPRCDFFVPFPGFTLEFDESQHFTEPRLIALERYPTNLKLGFDRKTWVNRCRELCAEDDDPPYRDEQRAWYDTLRDFCALILDIPTVRVLPDEARWCGFRPNVYKDVKSFQDIIERKLALCHKNRISDHVLPQLETENNDNESFRIGLAFPELGQHNASHFCSVLTRSKNKLDLIVFLEAFESIKPKRNITPENIGNDPQVVSLVNKYLAISKRYKAGVVVGFQVDYASALANGGRNDQYCTIVGDVEDSYIYHKHSTSRQNAFFDSTWSIEKNFRVARIGGKNIGISICHDSYISLIPRVLKKKGAEVWVNISFQNVRPSIWEPIHHARAVENDLTAVCTLHRNSNRSNPQEEPYAFSEKGKIRLLDLETGKTIDSISIQERAGKIYFFDIAKYQTYYSDLIRETGISKKADPLLIESSTTLRKARDVDFFLAEIDIETFLHAPETLWQICLDSSPQIPFFVTRLKSDLEWKTHRDEVMKVVKGRAIEFSTLFLFVTGQERILMGAYRSSSYKDSRILYPDRFPFYIDKRYLKGLQSTFDISLGDLRNNDGTTYFQRIRRVIDFIRQTNP